VSPDGREGMERMVAKVFGEDGRPPEMVILSDPDHAVIDRYGIFNPNSSARHPFPHPTTYVIDKNGVVQYRFVAFDFRVGVTNEAILNVLKGL